jgi:ferredoxin
MIATLVYAYDYQRAGYGYPYVANRCHIARGERVLSSECILCQACLSVCPEQALTLSFGFDAGALELLRERDGATMPLASSAATTKGGTR